MTALEERFEAAEKISSRLIKSSLKQSYNPWTDLDWEAPLVEGAPYIPLHRSTLYGTELWEQMTHEQRIELTRHESASIASSGIWFEIILMQLVLRALYDMDPRTAQAHWALTEIADECHHSIMFGKALERTGMPPHRHSKVFNELGRIFKAIGWGPSSYAAILVAEWILDEAQREMMTDESVEPLVRRVSQIHVTEEARHIRFAKEQIADMMKHGMDPVERTVQQTMCAVVGYFIVESLISPGVYKAVGLKRKEAVKAARENPNLHSTRAEWGKELVEFLDENGLIGGPAAGLWRASHLISDADVERGLLGKGVDTSTTAALAAASTVLGSIPGIRKLGIGTLAGVGSGPGKNPWPGRERGERRSVLEDPLQVVRHPFRTAGDAVRPVTESAPIQALRKLLPLGLRSDPVAPSERPRTRPESSKSLHRLKVASIERLTPDAVAVTFEVPDSLKQLYRYKQGQHVTIEAVIEGERVRRSYSICSSVASQTLRIGVKKVPGGPFSSYIVDELKEGDEVDVVPPAGRFFTELEDVNTNHYVGVAGGSGITPILSIMKSVLETEYGSRFTLLYANRDRESIMFFDEIADLQRQVGDRLEVVHVLEEGGHSGPGFRNGRIDEHLLGSLPSDVSDWFLCGPTPMTEAAEQALHKMGAPGDVHLELFNTIGTKNPGPGTVGTMGLAATLRFSFEGADETIETEKGELLLDAALRTGQDIPWSCREAVCGMCRAKVCGGETTPMLENHSLTDDEVSDGFVLTCQTRPATPELELDFDA